MNRPPPSPPFSPPGGGGGRGGGGGGVGGLWLRFVARFLCCCLPLDPALPPPPPFSPSGGEGARRAVEGDSDRFMAPIRVRILEVFPPHEPGGTSNIEWRREPSLTSAASCGVRLNAETPPFLLPAGCAAVRPLTLG